MSRQLVTVTDEGVDRYVRRWFRSDIRESVSWRDLERVLLDADANLAGDDDLFLLLIGRDGTGVALAYNDAKRLGVLERLHELPGYDHEAEVLVAVSAYERRQVWPPATREQVR